MYQFTNNIQVILAGPVEWGLLEVQTLKLKVCDQQNRLDVKYEDICSKSIGLVYLFLK